MPSSACPIRSGLSGHGGQEPDATAHPDNSAGVHNQAQYEFPANNFSTTTAVMLSEVGTTDSENALTTSTRGTIARSAA